MEIARYSHLDYALLMAMLLSVFLLYRNCILLGTYLLCLICPRPLSGGIKR